MKRRTLLASMIAAMFAPAVAVPVRNAAPISLRAGKCSWEVNFGQKPFVYTPPPGFVPAIEPGVWLHSSGDVLRVELDLNTGPVTYTKWDPLSLDSNIGNQWYGGIDDV